MKDKQISYLKVNEIKPSRFSLRSSVYPYELGHLTKSIKAQGVIVPLLVRINEQSEFEVISGNRRLAAAREAGLSVVPCILKRVKPLSAYLLALSENIYTKSLTFFEEAEALCTLVDTYKLSPDRAARAIGISPTAFSHKTSLLRLNSHLIQRIKVSSLSEDYARLILKVPEEAREGLLDKIIAQNLSLSDTEKLIEKALTPKTKFLKTAIGDPKLFGNSLSKMVNTMNLSGIKVLSEKTETEEGIVYTVTIPK